MLTLITVLLIWSMIGCVISLWLSATDFECDLPAALLLIFACGPGGWAFVAWCFAVHWVRRLKGSL